MIVCRAVAKALLLKGQMTIVPQSPAVRTKLGDGSLPTVAIASMSFREVVYSLKLVDKQARRLLHYVWLFADLFPKERGSGCDHWRQLFFRFFRPHYSA
ncbi:hypothetical protein M514_07692 [Trichuris suis]|uniref:Uncharacterized protein n=1 Tax=Trichuris suis TaxID=68888 RepID=A0A085MXJ3_9BILA|nr:hypothetical protein M513_07692 [Trichuris suis]KFD61939.1 hypothetical protein M514_07692 [Trichuris suis]